MSTNWCDVLGFQETHLDEIRYIAWTYLKEGKLEEAKRFFEGLIVLEPSNGYNWRTLGAIFLLQGDYNKAIEHCKKSLELEPNEESVQLNLAKAMLYLGQRDAGLDIAKKLSQGTNRIADDAGALVLAYGQ